MKHLAAIAFAALFSGAAFAGCTGGCSGGEAPSVSTAWSGDAKAPTRLILVSPSHNYGGPLWMAIEMDIAKGWFVYADPTSSAAGLALGWTGSENLAPPVLRWPSPAVVDDRGKPVKAWTGHVILPISVSPLEPERDIRVGLTVSYAVCGEVCRPGYAVHAIRISAAPAEVPPAGSRHAAAIAGVLMEPR
ncbi:MAG: protein-disulfide reductase DsbD family protein [Alphaproteobacteria bacterium]|jgi:DsbC/DsbD-like thiol-disulfide interchange protein